MWGLDRDGCLIFFFFMIVFALLDSQHNITGEKDSGTF